MATVDLYEPEYPYAIETLADSIASNIRMLRWILENIDGENIIEVNTSKSKIISDSEKLSIDGDVIKVDNNKGGISCEITPDGLFVQDISIGGEADFKKASKVTGLRTASDGTHSHGVPIGTILVTKLPNGRYGEVKVTGSSHFHDIGRQDE